MNQNLFPVQLLITSPKRSPLALSRCIALVVVYTITLVQMRALEKIKKKRNNEAKEDER